MPTVKTTIAEFGATGLFTLSADQTGNGDSANIADRGVANIGKPGAVILTSTVGATPTVKVDIKGSVDGTNWFNVAYALVATPETVTVAQITVTTAVTMTYLLRPNHPWRFLKLVYSANTNVTLGATAYL
jgi:hypothetical protein